MYASARGGVVRIAVIGLLCGTLAAAALDAPAQARPSTQAAATGPASASSTDGERDARPAAVRRARLRSITPAVGPLSGGTKVVIKGVRFRKVRWVKFGTVKATHVRVKSARKLVVRAPRHAPGAVNVKVRTAAGRARGHVVYRYQFPPPPRQLGGAGAPSCATETFCLVSDYSGYVYRFDGTTWSGPTYVGLSGISCVSPTFCLGAGGGYARVFNGSTWSAPTAIGVTSNISCATATFCAGIGEFYARIFKNGAWSGRAKIDTVGNDIVDVACGSPTMCIATDAGGYVMRYNGSSWSAPVKVSSTATGGFAVTCPTGSFCVAVDDGRNAFTFDGSTWSGPTSILAAGDLVHDVSCVSATFCLAVTSQGKEMTFNGTTWTAPSEQFPGGTGNHMTNVSCVSTTFCVGVNSDGYGSQYDGTSWSAPVLFSPWTG